MARVTSIFNQDFTEGELDLIDPRIRKAMQGWRAEYVHKGQNVSIPNTWDSSVYPYKYFEVFHDDTDPFPGILKTVDGVVTSDENEIQLHMSGGWKGLDDEFIINFLILGYKCLDGTQQVEAQIHRFSGEALKIYYKDKLITTFKKKRWWNKWFGNPKDFFMKHVPNVLDL